MIKERHRYLQGIDIRQREVGGWIDNEEFKIEEKAEALNLRFFICFSTSTDAAWL